MACHFSGVRDRFGNAYHGGLLHFSMFKISYTFLKVKYPYYPDMNLQFIGSIPTCPKKIHFDDAAQKADTVGS